MHLKLVSARPSLCGLCLAQVFKGAWRHTEDSLECPGEMKRIAETEFERYLLNRGIRRLKPLSRGFHFQTHQVLVWTLVIESFEEPAKIGAIDTAFFSNLIEASKSKTIFSYDFSGTLIGVKSRRCVLMFNNGSFGSF